MNKDRETFEDALNNFENAVNNFKKVLAKDCEEAVKKARVVFKKIYEITKDATEEDVSRRKFEAVACKGRNRKGRR